MKIVIAPQGFKGSLSAMDAARAVEQGVRRVFPTAQMVLVPVADGGDGTLEALVDASGGRIMTSEVTGPIGDKVQAQWGALGDGRTAVIEMARAAGLVLVLPERRNPLVATTYGVGELIRHALDSGFRKLIIGIGGSATNDGGAGMAQALGARLLDEKGKELPPGGAALARLDRIDVSAMDSRLKECEVLVATDVTNPLTGPQGAAAVYGPQKGATPEMVEELDRALEHFAAIARRDLGIDVKDTPGAGAAGGLGAGLMAFLGAQLRPGGEVVLEAVRFDERLKEASLVITGEGRMDSQTAYNKAPVCVARHAKALEIPVVAICGSLGEGYQAVHQHGIDATFAITTRPMSEEEAQRDAERLLAETTEEVMQAVKVRNRLVE